MSIYKSTCSECNCQNNQDYDENATEGKVVLPVQEVIPAADVAGMKEEWKRRSFGVKVEQAELTLSLPGKADPSAVQAAQQQAVADLNSTILELKAAKTSNEEALATAQTEEHQDLSDIGALYLEGQKIQQKLKQLLASTSLSISVPAPGVVYTLAPGIVAYIQELDMTVLWCNNQGIQQTEALSKSSLQVKKNSINDTFAAEGVESEADEADQPISRSDQSRSTSSDEDES